MRRKSSGGKRLPEMGADPTAPSAVGAVSIRASVLYRRRVASLARRDYQEGPRVREPAGAAAASSLRQPFCCCVRRTWLAPLIELESPPPGRQLQCLRPRVPILVARVAESASSPSVDCTRALMLSDLDSFPQPVPLPDEARSPSPTLILFSEQMRGRHRKPCSVVTWRTGPYEEIDSAGKSLRLGHSSRFRTAAAVAVRPGGRLIDISQEDDVHLPKDKDSRRAGIA
ncbi:hypothetical protein MRX96_057431 [Rhipicephalus microplus]